MPHLRHLCTPTLLCVSPLRLASPPRLSALPLRPASLPPPRPPPSPPPVVHFRSLPLHLCEKPFLPPSKRFHLCKSNLLQGFHKVEVDGEGQPASKMPAPLRWSPAFLDPSLRISREADGTFSVYSKARMLVMCHACGVHTHATRKTAHHPHLPPWPLRWSRQRRRLPSRGLPRRRWSLRKKRRRSTTTGRGGTGRPTGGGRPSLGVGPKSPERRGESVRGTAELRAIAGGEAMDIEA